MNPSGDRLARVVRPWCVCAAVGVLVAMIVDAWATEWHGGGRVVIAMLAVAHLVVVPWAGRVAWGRGLVEAGVFGVLAGPLAEVSRQMAGAAVERVVVVCIAIAALHVVGVVAGRLSSRLRRVAYQPAVAVLAAWPLVGYLLGEFFGVASEGFAAGGPFAWLAMLLDAPR